MGWLFRLRFKYTSLLLMACLGFLMGIGLAWTGYVVGYVWCLASLFMAAATFRWHSIWTIFWIVLFGITLGWWRGSAYLLQLADYNVLYGQKITVIVQASGDALYGKGGQLSFDVGNVHLENGQRLIGKLQISGYGENAVFDSDVLIVTGKIYPSYGTYSGKMSYAQITVIEKHPSVVAELRRKFSAGIQTALPEPAASFVLGILVGQRATMPDEVKEDLKTVGLTHIIAVSGFNLTIMLNASKNLLGRRSKRLSTALSFTLIGIFLLFAGASASLVRAGIVSVLCVITAYYGRNIKPFTLIALAASITAFANPMYEWRDMSWYLSFLAFYGVMILSPQFNTRLTPRLQNSVIVGVAMESLCAEIMTLPYILHNFGQMSLVNLIANVLITTLIPLAMLLGLIAGLAGMFCSVVAGWFTWPATILTTYMLDTAHVLANIPNIFIENLGLTFHQMIAMYVVVFLFSIILTIRTKQLNYDKLTDRIRAKQKGVST